MLLAKHRCFLRAFQLKNKFCHLTLKNPKKQSIVRQLSSCINKRYNGFHVISFEYSKKLRKNLKPIDIIYKPVKSPEKHIQCYYSQNISKSYRNSCGDCEKLSHGFTFDYYYCGKFFARETKKTY